MLRFDGGTTANIYAGFRAAYRTWLEIIGSDGGLTVPNPFRPGPLETLELERNGALERIDVAGSPEIFVREIEDFEASVLDGAPPVVSLAESRRTAATLGSTRSPRATRANVCPYPKRSRLSRRSLTCEGRCILNRWRRRVRRCCGGCSARAPRRPNARMR